MKDLDRVDGKAKVTGTATYAAEYEFPGLVYGVLACSTIANGTITSMDVKKAEQAPGVLAVMTHENLPSPPGYKSATQDNKPASPKRGYKVFEDNIIHFNGQPIALVIADTFERATYAASLVKAVYKADAPDTDFEKARKAGKSLEGNDEFKDYVRGKADAYKNAPVKIEQQYSSPLEVHNPMEMHAVTVVWEGDSKVTMYDKTQSLLDAQKNVMDLFNLKKEDVHIICKYIGGAFGSAFSFWPHTAAALMGARKVKKPLKVTLTRNQMFMLVGYRPEAVQKVGMGTGKDGKLLGITHEADAMTASYETFTEGIVNISRTLYACPNVNTRYKVYPLHLSVPTWMRGPGETTGTFALECAIDEMAYAVNMDPLAFRLLNYSENDPGHNREHSSKFLKEAFQMGSDGIGWKDRNLKPRSMKEGNMLVGYGMGTGVFIAWRGGSSLGVKFTSDGTLILSSAVTDMGPGTATAMTNLASQKFGIAPEKIKFVMGDSDLAPGIFQGGSGTTSSLGTTVNNAAQTLKQKLVDIVKQTSIFHTEQIHEVDLKDLIFQDGYMMLASEPERKISYTEVLKYGNVPQLEIVEKSEGFDGGGYTSYSYSAHFVKVLVNPQTGVVTVNKVVSAIDAGTIVNEKTARSQIIGGVIGGIGMALMEEGVIDHRYGRWINNNFADYHVPVNKDVPHIEALFVNKPDPIVNPIGAKGLGEVSMVGFPAAVANAVFHATGKRVRDLPITPDKLLS
ncbi:MAG: xanthine dehydrogenase family protein molybdopterin-binding subunit [Ginsengibacter sp.]